MHIGEEGRPRTCKVASASTLWDGTVDPGER